MKFGFFAYREWALNIYSFLQTEYDIDLFLPPVTYQELDDYRALFFVGWSWKVPSEIIQKYECVCLHPSPLPRYRGGSPIQHQIMNGESLSAVTLFRMTDEIDAGDIYSQRGYSLTGDLKGIFEKIMFAGLDLIGNLLNEYEKGVTPKTTPQKGEPTYYNRRTPEQSEITVDMIKNCSAEYLYNFVRALDDPYPNAFIRGCDGKRIFLKKVEAEGVE